jgi:putative FmdB family regulatory protein
VPTYQYACTVPSCGHRFEAVQTFTEPALTVCPVCDGGLRKVFSPVGVVFKGSGFYRNDSRGSDSKKSTSPEKTEKSSSSSTEKKSESSASSTSSSSDTSTSSASTSTSKAAAS